MPLVVGAQSAATGAFSVDNCCRFNGVNAYLDLTFGTPTNNDKWSLSMWVKRCGDLDINQYMLVGASGGTNYTEIHFNPDNNFRYGDYQGSITGELITTRLFRDVGGWYHFLYVYDSANGTPGDRMKLYVNGTEETVFSTDTNPSSGQNSMINSAVSHTLGSNVAEGGTVYFDGYMAEVVFCDGQAYGPTDFGEFNEDSPTVWQPKDPSGLTFGDNGCYLDFEDSADLGADVSGNSNDWTLNNIDATDQGTDSPTNNFAIPNSQSNYFQGYGYTEGNCYVADSKDGTYYTGTMGAANGKWYFEFEMADILSANGDWTPGLASSMCTTGTSHLGTSHLGAYSYNVANGQKLSLSGGNSSAGWGSTAKANGDITMIALDCDNNKMWIGVNGVWQASGDPAGGTNESYAIVAPADTLDGVYYPAAGDREAAAHETACNWGGCSGFTVSSGNADGNGYGNFEYAPPTGFYALCTKNLAEFG